RTSSAPSRDARRRRRAAGSGSGHRASGRPRRSPPGSAAPSRRPRSTAPRRSPCESRSRTTERSPCRPSGTHLGMDCSGAMRGPALTLRAGTDEDRDLAEVAVFQHQLVRLGDAVEAERTPQHGADLAAVDQLVGLRALVRVGEVRTDDLLLFHPQVANVEVEVEARGARADDDLAEWLDREHGGGEGRLADVLEDDVGGVPEDLLDALGEFARDAEAGLLLLGCLTAAAHHARELVAVDVVAGAEALDELALLGVGDHAHAVGSRGGAQLRGKDAEAAGGAPDQHALARLEVAAGDQH